MKRTLLLMAIGLVGSLLAIESASAGGYPYFGSYPFYFGTTPFTLSERRIPYFSEHPPVYYSYPVARTYGLSPYAYPPIPPANYSSPAPLEIENPYVPPKQEEEQVDPTSDRTASRGVRRPRVVTNPYVTGERDVARVSK